MSAGQSKRVSKTRLLYLADACVSISQVFFGIGAAGAFISPFDIARIPVVLWTLILGFMFLIIGWKILR